MGKHSPQFKRSQRKRQKAKRKLKFGCNAESTTSTCVSDFLSTDSLPNSPVETSDDEELDALGVDLDVVKMTFENPYKDEFTNEYLQDCRRKLMQKVSAYRNKIESLKLQQSEAVRKHKAQLDRIRSFYQTIAFASTRTGKIVKTSLETSSTAASIMKELESTYKGQQYLY